MQGSIFTAFEGCALNLRHLKLQHLNPGLMLLLIFLQSQDLLTQASIAVKGFLIAAFEI